MNSFPTEWKDSTHMHVTRLQLICICYFYSVSSMSEDDGPESGCDTVEGSPTSDTSTSPRGRSPYRYLDNNNHNHRPPLAAMVGALPSPAVPGRSPRGVRTMVVPPMRVQNNNTQATEERFQRIGQWLESLQEGQICPFVCVCKMLCTIQT